MRRQRGHHIFVFFAAGLLLVLTGCGSDCKAPALNTQKLERIRRSLFSSGTEARLVIPNPIDALGDANADIADSRLSSVFDPFHLDGLVDPSRLGNEFLKIRIRDLNDNVSDLARASNGGFEFSLDDPHYAETMAYFGVQRMIRYVEALGFSVVKSRPLYVMVRAASEDPKEINAIYDHNYFNPQMPRTMRFMGDKTGVDLNMPDHEFGHLFNESVSREVGMDYAGDAGAIFTEGSALHECLADYLAMSVAGKRYIGRWLAKQIGGYQPGEPLRYAVDRDDGKSDFRKVSVNDGRGGNPERYTMAEWCDRVTLSIWAKIRERHPEEGAAISDRLVFSAVSLLKRDSSVRDFYEAMLSADEELHCGEFSEDIEHAFQSRGFNADPESLSRQLQLSAEPVAVDSGANSRSVGFQITIKNSSSQTARNVRVAVESDDLLLIPVVYMQGYGDIPGGRTLNIGGQGLGLDFSPTAEIDSRAPAGRAISYRLRLMTENGSDVFVEGKVTR